LGICEAGRFTI